MTEITLKDIKDFFGYATLPEFAKDWKLLSQDERSQIKGGIQDGTFDYVAG